MRYIANPISSWKNWIHIVAAFIIGSMSASVGKSPHYILCDLDKRLPNDILIGSVALDGNYVAGGTGVSTGVWWSLSLVVCDGCVCWCCVTDVSKLA